MNRCRPEQCWSIVLGHPTSPPFTYAGRHVDDIQRLDDVAVVSVQSVCVLAVMDNGLGPLISVLSLKAVMAARRKEQLVFSDSEP
jgi:hypothetical protein